MTTGSSTEGWFTARLSQWGAVVEVREEPRHPRRRLPSQLICIHSMAVMTHTTNEASNRTGELSITPAVSSSLYANVHTAPCRGAGVWAFSRAAVCVWCAKVRNSYRTCLPVTQRSPPGGVTAGENDGVRQVGAKRAAVVCADRSWLWVWHCFPASRVSAGVVHLMRMRC